jgi:hypothetical protein
MQKLGPVDRSALPLVPVSEQMLLQRQQLGSDLLAGTLPFGDGRQVTDQMGPAQLPLEQRQLCWAEKRSLTTVPAKPSPNSSIAAAAERLRPC